MVTPPERVGERDGHPHGSPLRIERVDRDGHDRMALVGELDIDTVPRAETVLGPIASNGSPLVLDLINLRYCDSQGIGLLFRLAQRAHENGGFMLTLANPRGLVRRVFDITGVARAMTVLDERYS